MNAIEIVEVWLRTSLSPFGYIERERFARTFDHRHFLGQLRDEQEGSKEEFVRHYKEKYDGERHLPIWMATELLTFGTLSLLYSALPLAIRKNVASPLGFDDSVVGGWLHCFGYMRNICAHHTAGFGIARWRFVPGVQKGGDTGRSITLRCIYRLSSSSTLSAPSPPDSIGGIG